MKKNWYVFNIWVFNAHVGIALRYGLIGRLRRIWPGGANLMFAVEVRDGAALRKALGKGWRTWPYEQPGERKDKEAMTYLCVRGDRWVWLETSNEELKPSAYPRKLTAASLLDTKTGRVFNLSVLHPDPLGKGLIGATDGARRQHALQVKKYVEWHFDRYNGDDVNISAGDVNETNTLDDLYRYKNANLLDLSAVGMFRDLGMRPAHWLAENISGAKPRLTEAFIGAREHVKVKS